MQNTHIIISGAANNDRRIPSIKMIRTISGCGLKEAKDIADSLQTGAIHRVELRQFTDDPAQQAEIHSCISELRSYGHTVTLQGGFEMYVEQLREMATIATMKGDYYVAKHLIEFLEKYF